ncbi:hypothetical protein PUN28_003240 [Cardiocondyla obscurior]|uniref:Uncharacterized protein n=1 Tax=Cardiocondyla obscurior TaxID=286306 RepID=A0AAW2GMZ7_9HYME
MVTALASASASASVCGKASASGSFASRRFASASLESERERERKRERERERERPRKIKIRYNTRTQRIASTDRDSSTDDNLPWACLSLLRVLSSESRFNRGWLSRRILSTRPDAFPKRRSTERRCALKQKKKKPAARCTLKLHGGGPPASAITTDKSEHLPETNLPEKVIRATGSVDVTLEPEVFRRDTERSSNEKRAPR